MLMGLGHHDFTQKKIQPNFTFNAHFAWNTSSDDLPTYFEWGTPANNENGKFLGGTSLLCNFVKFS